MKRVSTLPRWLAVGISVAIVAGLAGCTQAAGGEAAGGLAVVVGGRSNMPPSALDGLAAQALDRAADQQSYASVVVADGEPYISMRGRLTTTAQNDVARQQQKQRNREVLGRAVTDARAKKPETDLLAALDQAARSIASSSGPHTIVVVDSGLSTAGRLNFTQPGMIDADPQELADSLKKANELPDLSGDDVVFQGLGDVAPPQQSLSHARRANLIAIWTAIVKAGGAHTVDVEQSPLQGSSDPALPPVTPVVFAPDLTAPRGRWS